MRSGLPPVRFELAPWPGEARSAWASRETRTRQLSVRAGTGRHFENAVAEARAMLEAGDHERVVSRLGERRFARAVVTAWSDSRDLAQRTMTVHLLREFREPGRHLSRLTTIALARLLLMYFDLLDGWDPQLFDELSASTAAAVGAQALRSPDVVETLRSEGSYVLHRQGPKTLARHLLQTQTSVDAWLRDRHLGDGSRYKRVVMHAVYLALIEGADATGTDHQFLSEVTTDLITRLTNEADPRSERMFGHDVLEAMTAKRVRRPSDTWLEAIVRIAGDPRSRHTDAWRRWWGHVDERALDTALRWFAGADLRAFLDGIDAYAHATDNTSMVRMLERRARLLTGLYEQDLVRDVRLILGSDIRSWIRKATPLSLIDAPTLSGNGLGDTAVIYLDCGDFSLVEGSHNFQLYLYTRRPVERLSNRQTRDFTGSDLRYTIPNTHRGRFEAFRHDQFGAWVREALAFLRSEGIRLDERALVSPADYQDLLYRRARDGY